MGEAPDGAEALELAARHRPDVVLMDIRMPVLDGLAATRQLTASGPGAPKVVILTTFDLDDYVYEALRAGASGFLLKDAPRADLIAAVRVAAAGDALLAPVGDPAADRGVRRPAGRVAAVPVPARLADPARAGHPAAAGAGPDQPRDRRATWWSARPRSRPTSPTCWPSSASATASRPSSSPTRPAR